MNKKEDILNKLKIIYFNKYSQNYDDKFSNNDFHFILGEYLAREAGITGKELDDLEQEIQNKINKLKVFK